MHRLDHSFTQTNIKTHACMLLMQNTMDKKESYEHLGTSTRRLAAENEIPATAPLAPSWKRETGAHAATA